MPIQLANDKDVINNPKTLLKGDRIRSGPARSRRASRIAEILETVVAGKVREIAIARGRTYRFHSFRGEEAVRTEMLTRNHSPMDVAGARTCVDIPWELRPSLA